MWLQDIAMKKLFKLQASGLIGCLNDTGVTSENYRKLIMWKPFNVANKPDDDKIYLVSWLESDGKYSVGHRAYYLEDEGKFFSLENNNSHPLHVDIYFEIPETEIK